MSEIQELSQGLSDGVLGCKTGEKFSVYGAAPVVQAATPAATVTAGSTTTVCNTAVAEIQTALVNLGIMASA